jgi:predicted chitinase
MGLIKGSASKSEENRVTLKPVIEQVLSSLNKCLGNINVFRFSYVDAGNVHQITDDQIIPPKSGEAVVTSKESKQRPLPLVGEASIAKSLDIKTEVSSKLANMIAIGANSDKSKQSTLGSGGDTFGFINDNFVDRYIPNRTEPTNVSTSLDGKINSAVQFNNAIKSFYNSVNPDQSQVEAATSYYVDRMSNVKGRESATRASAMIPVSLNFKTNGISGLAMGHCFTIPDVLLPYTYSPKKTGGKKTDVVGFVVTGVSNTIESNIWDTSIKTNMIFLKNPEDYLLGEGSQIERRPSSLPPRPSNPFTSFDDSNALPISPGDPKTNLSIFKKELVAAGFSKEMVIAAMANVMKECGGKLIEEYVNYANTSNERIKDIFGSRMKNKSDAEITRLKNNQEEWLEAIYGVNSGKTGKNLGNTERGDAVKFIGRPWIGFTGKGIYSKYSKLVYGDERLVENPRLLMQADIASKVSAAYIKNLIPTYERGLGVNSKSISQADANLLITSMVGGQFLNRNNLNKIFTEIVNRVDGFSKTISRDYDKY